MSGMNAQKKRHLVRSLAIILLMMVILALITRLWPILLLMLLAIFCYALWMLVRIQKTPSPEQAPQSIEAETPQPAGPLTERDMIASAFGLLQRRVTEQVVADYPDARWIWSISNAMARFAAGESLEIMLNGAGGYRKASVLVQNLQFCGLSFTAQSPAPPEGENSTEAAEDTSEEEPESDCEETVDYGLLAFEWVSANVSRLIAQSSEAIAIGEAGIHIPESELPHGDSWQEICNELMHNGFASAVPVADGIQAQFKTTE